MQPRTSPLDLMDNLQSDYLSDPAEAKLSCLTVLLKDIRESSDCGISLDADIEEHCQYAGELLANKYPDGRRSECHGIAHHARAAFYATPLINLYCRYLNVTVSPEIQKLIQITLLFHDMGRMGEGKDYWEKDSGLLLFYYLTDVLKIDPEKAKVFAEAIANKDAKEKTYFELNIETKQWETKSSKPSPEKNPFPKEIMDLIFNVVYDGDCLDVQRAKDEGFKGEYLKFYQQIACKHPAAFADLTQLIRDVTSIIYLTGAARCMDDHKRQHLDRKEGSDVYQKIREEAKKHCTLIPQLQDKLFSGDELKAMTLVKKRRPYNPDLGLTTAENVDAMFYESKALARAMLPSPPYVFTIKDSKGQDIVMNWIDAEIHFAQLTNKIRSTSLFGNGGSVFYKVGFGISNYKITSLHYASKLDFGSAEGDYATKKSRINLLSVLGTGIEIDTEKVDLPKVEKEVQSVVQMQKLGYASCRHPRTGRMLPHTEFLYDITEFNFVYFTEDFTYTRFNCDWRYGDINWQYKIPDDKNHSSQLQADVLQRAHKKMCGKTLPIIEYSGTHDFVKLHGEYKDDEIFAMWEDMATAYFHLYSYKIDYCAQSVDSIMFGLVYGTSYPPKLDAKYYSCVAPDRDYPEHLRIRVRKMIEDKRKKILLNDQMAKLTRLLDAKNEYLNTAFFDYHDQLLLDDLPKDQFNFEIMQARAKNLFMQEIAELKLKTSQEFFYFSDQINRLYHFAKLFNFIDSIHKDLIDIDERLFPSILTEFLRYRAEIEWEKILNRIQKLQQNNLIGTLGKLQLQEIDRFIKREIDAEHKQILQQENDDNLLLFLVRNYFLIAHAGQFSLDQQKSVVCFIIDNLHEKAFKKYKEELFDQCFSFAINDIKIFEKILNHFFMSHTPSCLSNISEFKNGFNEYLNTIKTKMPNQTFSLEQQKVIDQFVPNCMVIEFIQNMNKAFRQYDSTVICENLNLNALAKYDKISTPAYTTHLYDSVFKKILHQANELKITEVVFKPSIFEGLVTHLPVELFTQHLCKLPIFSLLVKLLFEDEKLQDKGKMLILLENKLPDKKFNKDQLEVINEYSRECFIAFSEKYNSKASSAGKFSPNPSKVKIETPGKTLSFQI